MKVITVIIIDAGKHCNISTNLVHITETIKTEALNAKCAIFIKITQHKYLYNCNCVETSSNLYWYKFMMLVHKSISSKS